MPPYNISHWSETLEFLDVSGNLMTGTLSTELGVLHKMRMMSLDENHFTSTIPTELGRMGDSIQFLRFWRNDLSGTVPSELGQLSGLLDLAMHENPLLSGIVPSEVCTTPQRFLWFNCTSRLCGCGADFCPCSA
ncbi:Leucine Rich Repeat [Seminavis robusta]|uniref:Leucine Rich Repeat n=1 Tax=Seminavis robusta TaxID=568900 RepID=A0A9N8F058_9STRA|nr:Leucine Rich Repeat [Seminavis robusta]|eukprot:Sro2363_g324960.1 Leucine Rich Repeat (134) ;mRNA; r:12878-13279